MAKDGEREGGISRRDFLRGGAAVGALGTAGLFVGELPGPVPVRLRINGKNYDLELEPRMTLLDALRDKLELTGAKKVCDRGTCGACTVILDGKPVYACSLLAIDVQRQPIETVEGLGFCTPGFVMATRALLLQNPNPKLADVHHGLSGNFCRCGTYAGMRLAVLAAAPFARRIEEEEEAARAEGGEGGENIEDIEDGEVLDGGAPPPKSEAKAQKPGPQKPDKKKKKKKKRRGPRG